MDKYTIHGRLRIHRGNFGRDLLFLKEHVGKLSEPLAKKQPSTEEESWLVEFAATPGQWRIIEPELSKLDITATLLEDPAFLDETELKEQRYLTHISKKSNLWFVYLAGIILLFGGYLSLAVIHNIYVSFLIIIASSVIMGLGRFLVAKYVEKYRGYGSKYQRY